MAKQEKPPVHVEAWGVHALPDNIHLWDSPNYWENTCRVLAPSDAHPKGLIVLLPGQGGDSSYLLKVITRPIYDDAGKVEMRLPPQPDRHAPSGALKLLPVSVSSDLPNPGYLNGHTDNQLVRARDGSFLAVKSCLNWAPVAQPKPWQRICIRDREPDTHIGCRGTEVVWRGTWSAAANQGRGGLEWTLRGFTDPYVLQNGLYGYPRPLGCPDGTHPKGKDVASLNDQCKDPTPWTCPDLAGQCSKLNAEVGVLQGQIDDLCDPELIKHSTALAEKCKGFQQQLKQKQQQAAAWACKLQGWWTAPGSDRPEVYACPFTGYLYATAKFVSGPFPKSDGTAEPHREDALVLLSRDQGKSWEVLKSGLGRVPMVMTSTPNGRLFLYHWASKDDVFYGHVLCSNLFDSKNGETPQIYDEIKGNDVDVVGDATNGFRVEVDHGTLTYSEIVNGTSLATPMPPDATMKANSLRIAHPSISRASSDASTSRVRVSLLTLNEQGRNASVIVDIGVVESDGQPTVEVGSVRRAARIEASDPLGHSVVHGTFVDPDYISMPAGMASNLSLFYWLEWPSGGDVAKQMAARYCFFDGSPTKQGKAGPLSVKAGAPRTWKGSDAGGDYMSGGFFYHNGFNYLAQWQEPDGIRANIVRYVPRPAIKIPSADRA